MRTSLPAALLLAILLAACASNREAAPSKHIAQTSTLKVHPGLLGQPVPSELQDAPSTARPAAASTTKPPAE